MKLLYLLKRPFFYARCYFLGQRLFNTRVAFIGKRVKVQASKANLHFANSVSIQDNVFIQGAGEFSLGNKSMIKRDAYVIIGKGKLIVGDHSAIGKRSEISVNGGEIRIGNNVRMASNVFITNANHEFSDREKPIMSQGIDTRNVIIEDDVWIGHGAIILPGVTISKGAIVAAGAVVTKNVEAFSIVAGNPARHIKSR